MAKLRLKFILLLLALLIIGSGVYIYLERFAPVTMDEKTEISVWYVNDGIAMQRLNELVEDYNSAEGKKTGVTVTLTEFRSIEALRTALDSGEDMPEAVLCDTETAALLYSEGKLANINGYFDKWRLSEFPEKYTDAVKQKGKLVGLPILTETDVMLVNTKLFPDADSLNTYEQLCAVSEEYYKRNGSSFYTLESYTEFFRLAVLRLGGTFDGATPHESDDEDCIHIYNDLLAPSALNRGFDLSTGSAAQSVVDGEIPCAIVSSSSAADSIDGAGDASVKIMPVPYMKDGEATAVERLTLLCICDGNKNQRLASCLFAQWLTSPEINTKLASGSGYFAVTGDSVAGESKLHKQLFDLMEETIEGETVIYPPDAEYAAAAAEFELNLATLMDGLRNK